jgi:glucokinase
MARRAKPYVGIDLGGTNMQIGVVAPNNDIIGRSRKKTTADKGQAVVINRVIEGVQAACMQAGLTVTQLAGVGIGAPGAIDPATGVVLEAVNLRWDNVPLAKILQSKLRVPVLVDNDVNVALFGEWKAGAARGDRDVLGVWVGTGIGGALILNNHVYAGGFFTAGEIGHTILYPNAPMARRSLEQNCSRTAIADRLVALMRQNRKSMLLQLCGGDLTQIKSKMIAAAYSEGDKLTSEVLDETAQLLGVAIANVVTLLSLKKIVVGGGLTEALGEPWVKKIRKAVRETAFPERVQQVQVVASELEDDAGLLGAAMLAREKLAR